MKRKKKVNSDKVSIPKKRLYLLIGVFLFSIFWVNLGAVTQYGLQIKLKEDSIPTLVNGITASMSVVIGILIAVLGIMLRLAIERKDLKSKQFYLNGMIILLVPVVYLWTTYAFLASGLTQFAVNYALSALLTALLVCILIVLHMYVRLANQTEEDRAVGNDM